MNARQLIAELWRGAAQKPKGNADVLYQRRMLGGFDRQLLAPLASMVAGQRLRSVIAKERAVRGGCGFQVPLLGS